MNCAGGGGTGAAAAARTVKGRVFAHSHHHAALGIENEFVQSRVHADTTKKFI
jgi:hypothetical protein